MFLKVFVSAQFGHRNVVTKFGDVSRMYFYFSVIIYPYPTHIFTMNTITIIMLSLSKNFEGR